MPDSRLRTTLSQHFSAFEAELNTRFDLCAKQIMYDLAAAVDSGELHGEDIKRIVALRMQDFRQPLRGSLAQMTSIALAAGCAGLSLREGSVVRRRFGELAQILADYIGPAEPQAPLVKPNQVDG